MDMFYSPHAMCLLYDPALITGFVISNIGIAIAYFMIPLGLWLFIRRFPKLPFPQIPTMFAIFILSCGISHITKTLTLFYGGWFYWIDVAVCFVTMVASIITAGFLLVYGKRILLVAARMVVTQEV